MEFLSVTSDQCQSHYYYYEFSVRFWVFSVSIWREPASWRESRSQTRRRNSGRATRTVISDVALPWISRHLMPAHVLDSKICTTERVSLRAPHIRHIYREKRYCVCSSSIAPVLDHNFNLLVCRTFVNVQVFKYVFGIVAAAYILICCCIGLRRGHYLVTSRVIVSVLDVYIYILFILESFVVTTTRLYI